MDARFMESFLKSKVLGLAKGTKGWRMNKSLPSTRTQRLQAAYISFGKTFTYDEQ